MIGKPNSFFLAAAIVLVTAFSAFAQTKRPDFNRAQDYDVQHYLIKVSFDQKFKRVDGDTTITFKPLREMKEVDFDSVGILYNSVSFAGSTDSLAYNHPKKGKVTVYLPRTYGPNDTVSLRFRYQTIPSKGVYFVPAASRSENNSRSAQIWTQGEPDEARHWFPSFDFPSDKATTEQMITVAPDLTVIGNGELVEKITNPDGNVTWHYKMPVPHSTYLVSFVIGKYVRLDDKYRDIPLSSYVYPGKEKTGQTAFGDTKKMMTAFEEMTGVAYPFNKYDQSIVADFQFGGMENITATTMADTEIFFSEFEFGKGPVMDLVSHELAHSWFGNLVTCRNWAELWLNEGFATFMEAAWREKVNGREDYQKKIRADAAAFLVDDTINRRRHALFNLRAGDVGSLFDNAATTYNKGGAVVHTLREQVGDVAFWKGVNTYLNRHKFGSVESTDLRKAMEEASGQDLDWFFEQWVYGAGAPNISVKPVYSRRSKTLTLTFSQTQRPDTITPTVFRLPLDVVVNETSGTAIQKVVIDKRTQVVQIKASTKPKDIEIDPGEKIPLKKLQIKPIAVVN